MSNLEKIADTILRQKNVVLIVFLLVALVCAALMSLVNINYKLSDYLPEDNPSTTALQVIDENFDEEIPNLSIFIEDISIPEALQIKEQIKEMNGVESVLWLDDVIDVYKPLEIEDSATVEAWYKDGGALFSVSVNKDHLVEHIDSLTEFVGERGVMAGEAFNQAMAQSSTMEEIPKIILFVVPLVLIILLFSTSSWFEPVLFLITIGAAILINEGTNIFLGEVSFVTRSTSSILQLAVSMDYAVFLLHSFARLRKKNVNIQQAMSKAMVQSFSSISASAMTTILSFLVLALMRFKIGPDMGMVLAKGVLTSFISVMVLLPVLVISTSGLMDRTHHRPLLPSFEKFSRVVVRLCIPLSIIVMIIMVPGYLGQKNNQFIYGSSGMNSADSQAKIDMDKINSVFGESVQMVLLVPEGDIVKETQLGSALEQLENVTSVVSYSHMVGAQIPEDFLAADQLAHFRSGQYSRLILYVNTSDEGEDAFRAVEAVRETAKNYYWEEDYHLVGQSVVNYDLKDTIVKDNQVVSIAVILAIGLVLLLTFRSPSIAIVLLLAIKGATWLNLSIPYFAGYPLNYLGYQIISSVQLGATVDYGILFAQQYTWNRKIMDKRSAAGRTISDTAASILTPASILTIAGLMLGLVSSNGIISQMGAILGRGAMLSAGMVLLVLPGMLILFDKIIQKTTVKTAHKEEIEG
ncbi:efflux RND transporter permease subunit [Candidatus Contubernalis alkaliaceticus]|uniref:efflux RND transporter permease subunit n=1 Tax=Candidatus Contubernalis alkaliaceticus TaxID=338645 RepID=UPI001F4C3208|nr:MMPL family transporter [Candidatus Contubernalis alkalaceticus]UNC93038.1 MMPL family transporter [Candidatus Contubernalis alkalaceticus]